MAVAATPVIPALAGAVEDFDWSLCRTFLAVARRGSIAAATDELGLSHPAIRRQLERLETALGAPLFSRSQSGMALTQLAVALLAPAQDMERSARSMLREASSTDATGLVRIAADGLLGAELLPTVLRALRRDHPGIRYELMQKPDVDLVVRDADVGLHLDKPTQGRVVTSRIATFASGLFASRSWVAANGEPGDVRELAGRTALVGRTGDGVLHSVLGSVRPADFAVAVADDAQVPAYVAMGLGVGLLPLAAAGRHGDLVRILPGVSADGAVWLSVHPDLRSVPHVRFLLDAARERIPALLA